MKKTTLFLQLLIVSSLAAQNAPINFEPGGNGATWTFTTFENVGNLPLTVVANPNPSGANTSATVGTFTALQAGAPWAGFETTHGAGIGTFNLTSANAIVKMKVWKSVISDVGIKFATADNQSTGEIKVANTLVNQWEELTFNFTSKIGEASSTGIDQIIIFPDFNASRSSDNITYIDDITFSPAGTDPLSAAPSPLLPQSEVISMFSNAYNNVPVDTWKTDWSVATLTEEQIAGNDVKKYTGLSFAGIETVSSQLNITGMTHFNIDVWSPDYPEFKVKLVDFGANAAFGGGDDTEHEVSFASPVQGQWVTYKIPLANFTALANRQNIAQLILVGGNAKVYVDNVYFSNETSVVPVTEPVTAAPAPTPLPANVLSLFSNSYSNVPVDTWQTDWSNATLTDIQIQGNDTKKYDPLVFVGIETVASQIDITSMTYFNVDLWSHDVSVFKVKLVDFGANATFGGGDDVEHEITINAPAQGQWNSIKIPLADFENLITRQHIAQLILVADGAKVYIDNVYFSNEAVVVVPTDPTVAAPDPVLPQAAVISMFSNTYNNIAVDTWHTDWSDATLAEVQIAGNDVKKYNPLNFVGIETVSSPLDITGMTHFNVDVWSHNFTVFKVKLVDFGADGAFAGGDDVEHELTFNNPAQGEWISYNLPITDFTGLVTKQHIAQLIFVGGGGKVFVDNVYFSNSNLGVDEKAHAGVLMFPNPASSTVSISAPHTIDELVITDMLGKVVHRHRQPQTEVVVDVSSLAPGMYLVNTRANGKMDTSKLIIR